MNYLRNKTKKFIYWLGYQPSETSAFFSPRRDYRLQMGWA